MADTYGKMPNNVYVYSAQPRFKYGATIASDDSSILLNNNDNGVFVWRNTNYPPETTHSNGLGRINQAISGRETKVNTNSCVGAINMGVKTCGYAIELSPVNTGEWSSGGKILYVGVGLLRDNTRPRSTYRVVYLRDDSYHNNGILWNLDSTGNYYTNSVNKVEVCYKQPSLTSGGDFNETVYATGFTFFSAANINNDIRLPKLSTLTSTDDDSSTKNIVICRLVPFAKDYPFLTYDHNPPRYLCYEPSIVFNGLTGQIYYALYDSESPVTLVSGISQAIPDAVLRGNDGIMAVSMLAKTSKGAYWLGYKNGIYKLYQGPTPLNGMPGEKITIKGHEFVCLAYGPFYARMS